MGGEGAYGFIKVFVAFNDGTADITGYRITGCTGHFVALASTSQRQTSYWRLNSLHHIPSQKLHIVGKSWDEGGLKCTRTLLALRAVAHQRSS